MSLRVSSPAWKHGERIPTKYTADGDDVSPPLVFEGVPAGTRAFLLICDDPDARPRSWVHWLLYDIPGTAAGLPEGIPAHATLADGSRHGQNSWSRLGYGGPSPPRGRPHRYVFRLYALREPLRAGPGLSANEAERAARDRAIESAEFVGTYGRS